MSLEELTARAATILVGRCVAADALPESIAGAATERITFDVESVIKGPPGGSVSFRRLAGRRPAGDESMGLPEISAIREGDELLIFLYGESALGLTSPVGLGQGLFRIHRGKDGRRFVSGGLDGRFLLRGLSPAARRRLGDAADRPLPHPLPLETLLDLIARLRGDETGRSAPGRP